MMLNLSNDLVLESLETQIKLPSMELPLKLSKKVVDEKGNLWSLETSNVTFEAFYKNRTFVQIMAKITVHKNNAQMLRRDGLLFTYTVGSATCNSYLDYSSVFESMKESSEYCHGDENFLIQFVSPINDRLLRIARRLDSVTRSIIEPELKLNMKKTKFLNNVWEKTNNTGTTQ
jgi:hypothetical protein